MSAPAIDELATIRETLADHVYASELHPPESVLPYLWCACGWRSDDHAGPAITSLLDHLSNAVHEVMLAEGR